MAGKAFLWLCIWRLETYIQTCFGALHASDTDNTLIPREQSYDGRRSWLDCSKTFALPCGNCPKIPDS